MSGLTAVYGIRYPSIGDAISATDFQNWANDIDAAMQQARTAAEQQPDVFGMSSPTNVITQGSDTVISFGSGDTPWWNGNTTVTALRAGMYDLTGDVAFNVLGAATAIRLAVRINGALYAAEQGRSTGSNIIRLTLQVAAPLRVGDQVQWAVRWVGTGTTTSNYSVKATHSQLTDGL